MHVGMVEHVYPLTRATVLQVILENTVEQVWLCPYM